MENWMCQSFNNPHSEIPLWEETMTRLSTLSSSIELDSFDDDFKSSPSDYKTKHFFEDSKLNSVGNSPASSLDECLKPRVESDFHVTIGKQCYNQNEDKFLAHSKDRNFNVPSSCPESKSFCDDYENNISGVNYSFSSSSHANCITSTLRSQNPPPPTVEIGDLTNIISFSSSCSDFPLESKTSACTNKHSRETDLTNSFTSSLHSSKETDCPVKNCYVDLGDKLDRDLQNSPDENYSNIKKCRVVLKDLLHFGDAKTKKLIRNYKIQKKRTKKRKRKKSIKIEAVKEIPAKPEQSSRPKLSTSRWLNLWKEGDSMLNAELNFIHVTRNTVRSLQEIVHHDQ